MDNSGTLEHEEMVIMVQGLYNNVYKNNLGPSGLTVRQFVDICFSNLDSDNDGKLSLEEFKKVVLIEPQFVEFFLFSSPSTDNKGTLIL